MRRPLLALVALAASLTAAGPAAAICTVTAACSATPFVNNASCCAGATSCTLDGTHAISGPECVLDFGDRAVVLTGQLNVGSSSIAIKARSFTVKGLLNARGANPNPGGNVTIDVRRGAPLPFSVEGTSGARIDLSGYGRGGTLGIVADGPVSFLSTGTITADGIDVNADGGSIVVETTTDDGTVTVGQVLSAQSGLGGFGGSIEIVSAADFRLTDLGKLLVNGGLVDAGAIDIEARGAATMAKASLMQANGLGGGAGFGGSIEVFSGSLLAEGVIEAKGGGDATGDAGGDGGAVNLQTRSGPLKLQRTTLGVTVDGASGGGDGEVTLESFSPSNGLITIDAPISAQGFGGLLGKEAGGGTVSVSAAGALDVLKNINVNGVGYATGAVDLSAERSVNLSPTNGPITGVDPAGGGFLSVLAGHDVNVNANIQMQASLDRGAPGGAVDVVAANDLTVQGGKLVDVSGRTTGGGGSISMAAGRNLFVATSAELRANGGSTAGSPGGHITLAAGDGDTTGQLTVGGNVNALGRSTNPARYAQVDLAGCQVVLSGSANVDSRGDTASRNVVRGRTSVTVATNGKLRANFSNVAQLPPGLAPQIGGAIVQPGFTVTPVAVCTPSTPAGTSCLMPCPQCGNGGAPQFPEQCEPTAMNCQTCDPRCRTRTCDDGNACTALAQCDPLFGCLNEPVANGAGCADADACNGAESCQEGSCTGGVPPVCTDSNPCTDDLCDVDDGCQHVPITGPGQGGCNDRCTQTCAAGACTAKTPPNCNDDDPLTVDSCNPSTGLCEHVEAPQCTSAAQCNDGNPCTGDTCSSGRCQNLALNGQQTGCTDANGCDGTETCVNGTCVDGTPKACGDGNPCTTDTCNPLNGQCVNTAVAGCCTQPADCEGVPQCLTCESNQCATIDDCCLIDADCDDGKECTVDACQANLCAHTPKGDGTACGTMCAPGTCAGSTCTASPVECADDGDPCTADFCDPTLGCVHPRDPECCTGAAGDCDDADACTLDACDTQVGQCSHLPRVSSCTACAADTDCDPLGACAGRTCTAEGYCVDSAPHDCNDGNPSTFDVCELDAGGAPTCRRSCLNDGGCGDGLFCNGPEVCSAGSCVAGTPPPCDDGDLCTDDGCAAASDACVHTARTEFAGVTCRLDTIEAALAGAGPLDVLPKIGAKIRTLVGQARTGLEAARTLGPGKKGLKKLKGVGKKVGAIKKTVDGAARKRKISQPLADTIRSATQGGQAAVAALRPVLTP